ncbi:MAG: O-antigen ligase family protein [Planctomycetaceae bacterium]|nr:O-antigen ligase family protein [Planctomycetaceae bacterium]
MNGVVRAIASIALIIIIGALLVFPWFNGGADVRPQVYFLMATIAAVAVALICSLISADYRPNLPTTSIILLLALGLAGFQLLPISNLTWEALGNNTPELRQEMTSAEGLLLAGQTSENSTLSLYPSGTRQDLALLLVGITFFMLGAQFLSRFEPFRLFMILLATNGALLASFGFVQQITWNGKLYWSLPVPHGGTPFASFIYHNQAASIFAFSLAASIGYLIDLHRSQDSQAYDRAQQAEWGTQRNLGLLDRIHYYIADLTGERLFALTVLLLNVAGLLFSLSRGGLLCFLIAGIIIWSIASFKQGRSTWVNVFLFGGILTGLLTWVSMTDVVSERLETLLHSETFAEESRLPHWRDTLGAVEDHGTWGTGLGTYRYIYQEYQNHVNEGWFLHAHNQYLEALVDAGIPGLSLLVLMILLTLYACLKLFSSDYYYTYVVAIVGGLALFFQIFHGGVDYCLYLPATMVIFAAMCGALTGRAVRAGEGQRQLLVAIPKTSWTWPLVLAGLLAGSIWSYSRIESLNEMEKIIKSFPSEVSPSNIEIRNLRVLISQLEDALEKRPDDAQGQEALAEFYVLLYQLNARDIVVEEQKQVGKQLDPQSPELWELISPDVLAVGALQAHTSNNVQALKDIREQEAVVQFLQPAFTHFKASLESCPLQSHTHYRLNQLGMLDPNWTFQNEHLSRAERLGSWKSQLMFLAGKTRLYLGQRELALKDWRQSLEINPQHLDQVIKLTYRWIKPEELLDQLLPQKPELLIVIAENLYATPQTEEGRDLTLARLEKLLEEGTWPAGAEEYYRAQIAVLRGETEVALDFFWKAINLNPTDLDWNFQYAMLLRAEGKLQEAERILDYCVRQAPQRTRFSHMLNLVREQRKQQDAMKPTDPQRS